MAGLDLSSILDNITSLGSQAASAASDATTAITGNNQALTASYQQSQDRQNVVAANTKVVADVQNQGKLAAQNALQNFSAEWGGDTDDATGQQARLALRHNQASQAADDALDVIRQKRSVSFFDDPLSWISNKLTINTDIDNYNANNTITAKAESDMDSINASIDLRANAQAKIATTITAASAQAQSQITVASAQEAADVLARQGIAANTAGVTEIANMSYRQMQVATAGFDADAKYQELKTSQAHLALAQGQFDLEKQRFNLQEQKSLDQMGADQYISSLIKLGRQIKYPNQPGAWNIPQGKYTALLNAKDPELMDDLRVGQANETKGGAGVRILGNTPSEALATLQYKPTVTPDMAGGIGILDQATALVTKQLQGQPITTKQQKDQFDQAVNAAANQLLQAAANHTNDPTSVYYLPPADKLAVAIPAIQDSPLYKTVIAPAVAAKVDLSNPDVVTGLASKAVQAGLLTLNDAAAGISGMYQRGQEMNFASKQLVGLGLTPKLTYIGQAANAGKFGGLAGKLDYLDQKAVTQNLMQRSSASQFNDVIPAL